MTPAELGLRSDEYFYEPFNLNKIHMKGTLVKVNDSFIMQRKAKGEDIYKYARFSNVYRTDKEFCYIFDAAVNPNISSVAFQYDKEENKKFYNSKSWYKVMPYELDYYIEEYVRDFSREVDRPKFKCMQKDSDFPEIRRAWAILAAAMIISLLFNGFQVFWFIEILIFCSWRSDFKNK